MSLIHLILYFSYETVKHYQKKINIADGGFF